MKKLYDSESFSSYVVFVFAVLSYIDGTAISSDYTPVSTTVTLPVDPVTSIEVPITIIGDTVIENDDIFTVSLEMASAPAGYVNTDGITIDATSFSSEVTIVNDDTRKRFHVNTDNLQSHTTHYCLTSYKCLYRPFALTSQDVTLEAKTMKHMAPT